MIKNESTVYHPIGAGSNVYKTAFLDYIRTQLHKNKVQISIGAQPNSIPHFGTLVVFNLAFSMAKLLMQKYPELECTILFEMVDTAPAKLETIDGVEYQTSLKYNGLVYLSVYEQLLQHLKEIHKIDYRIRSQAEFNQSCYINEIICNIVKNHEKIDIFLAPDTKNLRIRIACPVCGRSEKKAHNLIIKDTLLESTCPYHGKYSVDIQTQTYLLEYNTPLRNLIRQLIYMKESLDPSLDYCWLRLTGSDYAGFYQEQTFYKAASALGYTLESVPLIIYAPLVTDWSGAKLSKSLYVKHGAYKDLPQYLLDYKSLIDSFGIDGIRYLSEITDDWIKNPYKLFRSYSVEYFQYKFESRFGVIK